VNRLLRTDGAFLANYHRGSDDYTGVEWVYPGGVTYQSATMAALAEQHGLQMIELDWHHPANVTWIILAAPKFDAWFVGKPLTWNLFATTHSI
jgi:hypothetical protein